ncbi:MAG: hypothetical protein WBP61_14315 [Nocardioides sp.]
MRLFSGLLVTLLAASLTVSVTVGLAPAGAALASAARPIEDYASYDPSRKCHPKPYAGTRELSRWVARRHGGGYVGTGRACRPKDGPTSDHQTGRAFDWSVDATKRADRKRARAFLQRIFATDKRGNRDALARRMGIAYVIWDDQMYPAWEGFRAERYLSSSCKTRKKCSKTLRHRDHVHVSLSKAGAKARTSWYQRR